MKKILLTATLAMTSFAYADSNNAINTSTIDGYWQTVDDSSGQPKGVVQIYTQNGVTAGKVMGGYPVNGVVPHQICTKCPAPFTNQPVTGMQILWGFNYDQAEQEFENGRILDPDSGNVYHALLALQNNGQNLKVHGYIGLPIIGRTQVWNRLSIDQYNNFIKAYYPSGS